MDRTRVGVVGGGVMGREIAALLAGAGYETTVADVDEAALAAAREYHETAASVDLTAAGLDPDSSLEKRLAYATDLDALADCEFVVEAISEDLAAKRGLLEGLEAVLDPEAVVGTNTSSLTPGDVAANAAHPERVVLFHFAKPAIDRPLVEISGDGAADWAIDRAVTIGEAIGKEPVVFDRELRANGLSRLSAAIKCAASWELDRALESRATDSTVEHGASTLEHDASVIERGAAGIDRGAQAMGFERGPFELIDDIGLDVHLATVEHLREPYDGRFDPPHLVHERMREWRAADRRGRKDGHGFFEWTDGQPQIPEADPANVQPIVAALVAEAHRMVADGVADAETVNRVLVLGSAGETGPFDIEGMVGADHLRSVLAERQEATGAAIYEPW